MYKTIFRYVVIGIITYLLADFLNVLLPIPTEEMVGGFLSPDESERDGKILFMMRMVVWVFAIDVVQRLGMPLFGFFMPRARRYAESKALRRTQGFLMELSIVLFLFCVIVLPIGYGLMLPSLEERVYEDFGDWGDWIDKEITETQSPELERLIDSMKTRVHEEAQLHNQWLSRFIDKPTGFGKMLFSDLTTDWVIPRDSWFKVPYLEGNEAYPSLHSDWEKHRNTGFASQNIQGDERYLERREEFNRTVKSYDHFRRQAEAVMGLRNEIDRLKIEHPLEALKEAYGSFWYPVLILVFICYGLTHLEGIRPGFATLYGPVVRFFEQGRFGLGGSARFAGLIEEWAELIDNQKYGLFLGKSLYNPFLRIGSEDPRHMLTIASTRAGKGATAIIPNLILWKGSTIVIDPKGTNAKVTTKRRKKFGDVHVIDPFAETGEDAMGFAASFNPLQVLDPNVPDIRERIYSIADALVVPDPEAREKHWDDGARTVIAGLIGHLVSSPVYERPTLPMIRPFLTQSPKEQEELWVDMMLNEGAGGLPKDCASRILRGIETNEIASILSNANKHTEWLSSPAIKNVLEESTFDFATIKEKPTSVYLVLPPKHLVNHNRFLRLFINVALNEMTEGGRSKVPVLCIMDEFLSLGKMEEVEKGFGLLAGYNLIMWPFIQDLSSLKKLYGEGASAFLNNCRAVQVFGVSDPETTGYVSERLGERSLEGVMDAEKRQRRNVNLRMKSEVALDISTYSDRQYVLRAGLAPLLLEKEYYYNSSKFKGLYEKDPDYS